jgi:hypothetical protein
MNKYRVSIARLETRVYYFDIEADSEEAAKDATWSKYNNDYWGEGECVHAEEWLQDTEVLHG